MTVSFTTQAEIRFGYGRSGSVRAPGDVGDMLTGVSGPDEIAARFPVPSFARSVEVARNHRRLRRARKKKEPGAAQAFKLANVDALRGAAGELRASLIRPLVSPNGFRERLVRFWADHFTVSARKPGLRFVANAFVEDAIRPHIGGSFQALLRKVETHPAMLVYLDQVSSVGPNSKIGRKRNRGLNENLAREIIELHTLGVGGNYRQHDVRQFAKLLTGLAYTFRHGFKFRPAAAEPGAEIVLGKEYGGDPAKLGDIHAALDDLAHHPDTARHIARKLAVHFVSDRPEDALVAHVEAAFNETGGDLLATYEALLEHPAAWEGFGLKARQPFDFIVAAMRAMDVDPERIANLALQPTRLFFAAPLRVMGQPFLQAAGPDGWPEGIEDWITPQGLAARIQWALIATNALGRMIDPTKLAQTALAEAFSPELLKVTARAESRLEGMALVFASPEFNRR
ncbi:MAG: DUF1800 family protein [Paracoccaceae bacterium]